MMKVLVTGGAGYIGSHTVVELLAAGHEVMVVDNFSNSSPVVFERLQQITGREIPWVELDVRDGAALERVVTEHKPDAVIHFAGLKAVGESVEQPLAYYRNNLDSTLSLCEVMAKCGVRRLVFSSSATVYGDPERVPIPETAALHTTNPYGQTKLMIEQILRDVVVAERSWRVAILRYFNPVGAHESGLIGEDPQGPPNNLVPYIAQVAVGRRPSLRVFGDDYDTVDGTGVRDYLHVVDLARGHVKALEKMPAAGRVATYNLGTGRGVSVLEMVHAFEKACGHAIKYEAVARRPGDIAVCYADAGLAERELGWKAQKGLDEMCADTWRWQSMNPQGFTRSS
jgi:UDP-glucose 4-epimerase